MEEFERKLSQFDLLLGMVPQQNFNVISRLCIFFKDCTDKSSVNNFSLNDASRMFCSVFCRTHSLGTLDESEIQKSCQVTQFLIEHSATLFKTQLIINRKEDKVRETRRKKEKESFMSYYKKARKEEKKNLRSSKYKRQSNESVVCDLFPLF